MLCKQYDEWIEDTEYDKINENLIINDRIFGDLNNRNVIPSHFEDCLNDFFDEMIVKSSLELRTKRREDEKKYIESVAKKSNDARVRLSRKPKSFAKIKNWNKNKCKSKKTK